REGRGEAANVTLPRSMPIRDSMGSSAATPVLRSGIACCTSTVQRTASTTLANSTGRLSPNGLDDAATVLGDLRSNELAAQRLESFERPFLVRLPPTAN